MASNQEFLSNPTRINEPVNTYWREDALCAQTSGELFFPAKGESIAAAKKICGQCDVGWECLQDALASKYKDGVAGGMSVMERAKLAEKSPEEIRRKFLATLAINEKR